MIKFHSLSLLIISVATLYRLDFDTMTDLKRIQLLIMINDFKIIILINSEVTRNVISFEFVTKHEVKTVRKRLALNLYEFNEKRMKELMNQKVTI